MYLVYNPKVKEEAVILIVTRQKQATDNLGGYLACQGIRQV